jgi:tRNA 2-(methylsulfanyl)-N6-isopentenyladenosine37 hydroxylase
VTAAATRGFDDLIPDEHVAALAVPTPPGWADVAVADLPATMSDHAHAEKKAALNALSLLSREPQRTEMARRMARLASEELSHLEAVLRHLRARGWTLAADRHDRYAAALLKLRRGGGHAELVDRLLIAALIEARSWERLHLLGRGLDAAEDPATAELGGFYRELAVSEAGHYRLFVELARAECPDEDVDGRLTQLAEAEAEIITGLPHEPRIH